MKILHKEFEYLAILWTELRDYAATGRLDCHNGAETCRLYFVFGQLRHAEGEPASALKEGTRALAQLIAWQSGQLEFVPGVMSEEHTITQAHFEVFEQSLAWLVRRGVLRPVEDPPLPTLDLPTTPDISTPNLVETVPIEQATPNPAETAVENLTAPAEEPFPTQETTNLSESAEISPALIVETPEPARPSLVETEFVLADITSPQFEPDTGPQPIPAPLFDEALFASVSFNIGRPGSASGLNAPPVKSFRLAQTYLPPAQLQEVSSVAVSDLAGLIEQTVGSGAEGFILIDQRPAYYARLFYQGGRLVEVNFEDGQSRLKNEAALQQLLSQAGRQPSRVKIGQVEGGLLAAYWGLQVNPPSQLRGLPCRRLNVENRLRWLCRHQFTGAVRFYTPQDSVFYLLNQGRGLGGFEVRGSQLTRVRQPVAEFVAQAQTRLDVQPAPIKTPLPDLNFLTRQIHSRPTRRREDDLWFKLTS